MDELYSDSNNNNLDYYQTQFEQRNLNLDDIIKSCTVFMPSLIDDKKLNTFKNKSLEKLITMYSNNMTKFEQHLIDINNN
ncbi:hypothetical protein CTM97_04300 [Photobacterium phosphoreum]|uniref:Uncharacterized protein n=1 Tax=Photobacterium phosphoreum TaxID=659 RepID=A0A2T3JWH4_PHOPO|nr:hypothetical protein CTM96_08650 [Photobacterium phosphoreum]PSU43584.1 hypothetical protein CTM97_04300 [Photobacterium phosphoreum]PSU53683.1 hypothetical protein C9J18_04575 [Photobacterium phosphoreum]